MRYLVSDKLRDKIEFLKNSASEEGTLYLKYQESAKKMSNKFFEKFHVRPQINELRSSKHPGFDPSKAKDTPGYIDFKDRVMYVDYNRLKQEGQTFDDFIAHELGHWLDQYLGGTPGQLLFSKNIAPQIEQETGLKMKYTPPEAMASTINFLLVDNTLPGPIEKAFYKHIMTGLNK